MSSLRQWLNEAWSRHDKASRELADELLARAATLPDNDDGGEAQSAMGQRAEWTLATLQGRPAPALPESVTWGLLADVAQAEILQGQLAGARERLLGFEAAAASHPTEAAHRARMRALLAEMDDAEMKALCEETLAAT